MAVAGVKQQWILASLGFVLANWIVILYVVGSGLLDVPPAPPLALPLVTLNIALGIFALPLVWWGSRLGYASALVSGGLSLFNSLGGTGDIAAGNLPAELLIVIIPSVVVSLFLLYAAAAAWRE